MPPKKPSWKDPTPSPYTKKQWDLSLQRADSVLRARFVKAFKKEKEDAKKENRLVQLDMLAKSEKNYIKEEMEKSRNDGSLKHTAIENDTKGRIKEKKSFKEYLEYITDRRQTLIVDDDNEYKSSSPEEDDEDEDYNESERAEAGKQKKRARKASVGKKKVAAKKGKKKADLEITDEISDENDDGEREEGEDSSSE